MTASSDGPADVPRPDFNEFGERIISTDSFTIDFSNLSDEELHRVVGDPVEWAEQVTEKLSDDPEWDDAIRNLPTSEQAPTLEALVNGLSERGASWSDLVRSLPAKTVSEPSGTFVDSLFPVQPCEHGGQCEDEAFCKRVREVQAKVQRKQVLSQITDEQNGAPDRDADPAGYRDWQLAQALAKPTPVDMVVDAANRLRANDESRALVQAAYVVDVRPPEAISGTAFLAEPDEVVDYSIEGLWPVEGNVLFVAADKCGKSTCMMCLTRSLCDGDPFLGHFHVNRPLVGAETVMLWDLEMSRPRVRSELRAQNIRNIDRLRVETLRGDCLRIDFSSDVVKRRIIDDLERNGVRVWIIDPIAPLLGQLRIDENDNNEVNQVLTTLEEIKKAAGVQEMMLTHHAGHAKEWRPRGASRFLGWPDAMWGLIRDTPDGQPVSNSDPRFFAARGRDAGADLRQVILGQDKRLTYLADTTRTAVRDDDLRTAFLSEIRAEGDQSGNDLLVAVQKAGFLIGDKSAALAVLRDMGADRDCPAHGHKLGTADNSKVAWWASEAACIHCRQTCSPKCGCRKC